MSEAGGCVSAIVLAAGRSRRMGRPKLNLPWQGGTVIGQVVAALAQGGGGAGLERILVVTGGARRQVEQALHDVALSVPLELAHNPDYTRGEMTRSLQVGLEALGEDTCAAMVCLGDQPQMQSETVRAVLNAYLSHQALLMVPSYQMRRGHPWIIDRSLWGVVLDLHPPATLRDFLNAHEAMIHYVVVDTPTILEDLDTPQDYERYLSQDPTRD
ncbi:MAG: nucleotidyltransferase family protein [Anaerolineales bacterium]|nr:nucleotidyltransferase family protein [Anaerolineales bacterium]